MENFILWFFSFKHVYMVVLVIFSISILLSNKPSGDTAAWLLAICLIPVFGIIAYLLFGINWRQRKFINKKKKNKADTISILSANFSKYDSEMIFSKHSTQKEDLQKFQNDETLTQNNKSIINLLYGCEKTLPCYNQSYEIYYNGKDAYTSLINDLKNASQSIYMEYYIWHSDKLGIKIKNILLEKAKEGLEIKLIFDGLGSLRTISKVYRDELKNAGVEFLYFLDIKTSILKLNYRNHRKMTIIDHKIVHTGGMNLADVYINGGDDFEKWRDTNIRLSGDIFAYYLAIFMTDWLNSGGERNFAHLSEDLTKSKENKTKDGFLAQVSSSGPDSNYPSLKYLYTKMIDDTKNEILIQTPYLIPADSILIQLKIAALSSKKVKIMITGKTDNIVTKWVAKTYIEELLRSGVEIYSYKKGFLHSKVLICDDDISTIGTCNFDNRSFNINYEINTIFYDKNINAELKTQFYKDLKECTQLTLNNLKKDRFFGKIRNSIFKLIGPLL